MSVLSVVQRDEGVNGTAKRPARKPRPASKPRPSRASMKHARRLAGAVGAVGVGVLGLSVAHCTESIRLLTGSHWALSGLLAVGIDAGMVVSELAELASFGTKAGPRVRPWACGYTVAAMGRVDTRRRRPRSGLRAGPRGGSFLASGGVVSPLFSPCFNPVSTWFGAA